MAPTLTRPTAKSLPEREEWPGIYWRWTTFKSDRDLNEKMVVSEGIWAVGLMMEQRELKKRESENTVTV